VAAGAGDGERSVPRCAVTFAGVTVAMMEAGMDAREFTTLTAGQLVRSALLLAFTVLAVVGVGMMLRVEKPARPFAATGPAAVAASARASAGPAEDAAVKRAGEILFGGGLDTNDPTALNKSVGEPVALRTRRAS
jgi:hypothetical protein